MLHTLSPRECGVLRMRYGLDDGIERTLEEIGRRFDVRVLSRFLQKLPCHGLFRLYAKHAICFLCQFDFLVDLPVRHHHPFATGHA